MRRAERRRIKREQNKKVPTYNLTETALKSAVNQELESKIREIEDNARTDAMILMFVLPLKVLMDFYWKKSYAHKLPEFTNHLLDYYNKWIDGELDMEQMKKDLWEYGGIRFEESK